MGTNPRSVSSVDFNGDGKLDLAIPNGTSGNVSILLGGATAGTFGSAVNFSAGTQPFSCTVADFNSDGKQDIATCDFGTNNASVLLGTGTGSFNAAVNFVVGTKPEFIITSDFNNDGKPDLATTNINSNNVSVLLNCNTTSLFESNKMTETIKLFPNPTSYVLNIEILASNSLMIDSNVSIQIVNSIGEVVLSMSYLDATKGINTSHLVQGMYFVTINNLGEKQNLKFIKN